MYKILFYILVLVFIAGCASTSTYRGGIGAYQNYEGFEDYLNRYSDLNDKNEYYENNTYSAGNPSNSKASSGNQTSSGASSGAETPPPENIKLGEARDSEEIQRATMKPYEVNGKWYYPERVKIGETYEGIASWYGPNFHNKQTSNGETYNMYLHTAAHKTLPMNTLVKVHSLDTNKSTIVRINDRGPFVDGRIIDLSSAAAKDIGMIGKGTARVTLEVIGFGGVVSNDAVKDEDVKDMVNSNQFNNEFKTGDVQEVLDGGNFAVQIGAFRSETGAETFKDAHKYDGYSTIIKQSELENKPIYKVFVSGFKSEDEANDFIKDKKISGFLVRD